MTLPHAKHALPEDGYLRDHHQPLPHTWHLNNTYAIEMRTALILPHSPNRYY